MDPMREWLAIGLVLGLLWMALWALRKKLPVRLAGGQLRAGGILESRGKLTLSPQHSVHWVRIGTRDVLLAVHPSGIVLLGDLAAGAPAASELAGSQDQ
jgi:flagellar biogenesis protein FliO